LFSRLTVTNGGNPLRIGYLDWVIVWGTAVVRKETGERRSPTHSIPTPGSTGRCSAVFVTRPIRLLPAQSLVLITATRTLQQTLFRPIAPFPIVKDYVSIGVGNRTNPGAIKGYSVSISYLSREIPTHRTSVGKKKIKFWRSLT
jgi:hypothetical protein